MITEKIEIPRPLVIKLLHHAQSSPTQEICGLIGSRKNIPTSCYPVPNASSTPQCRFQMDAKAQIGAMKAMQQNNEELFAIYHSHPTSEPMPSETDVQQASYPDALYIIISLNIKGVLEMRGFRLPANDPIKEVTLLLKEQEN